MTLIPGAHLGPYEILSCLGAGGMGEVYRARDTKLDRDVAIKILPGAFSHDADRVARFTREAKTLASLNHPNIAQIHGLEESGGVTALVMELVEGDDLSQRIARGAIPIDEALPIAKQIAEALEAAHEQGIIHRDLKPANIKVRRDGTVKVLDFGLAKAMEPPAGSSPSMSMSPTITTPAMTRAGMILGTAAYMSPEQAKGQHLDKRTDIWSFGCVLYEMLTGRRAFAGDDVSEVLASVLARDPDWTRFPQRLSPAVATFIKRCLDKNPRQRIADAQDLRLALEGAFDTAALQMTPPTVVTQSVGRRRVAMLTTGALTIGAVVAGTGVWVGTRPADLGPPRVSRLLVASSGPAALSIYGLDRDLAITPDGSRLVYVGNNFTQLFVRALDTLQPVVAFTGTPRGPFISPDGQWIGFVDAGTVLKKVAMTGGPVVTMATLDGTPRGATWGREDAIIVATSSRATGLQQVGKAGGPTIVLTRPDPAQGEADHVWPEPLPDGRAVLFTITAMTGGLDAAQVAVLDLQTGTRRVLVRGGSHAHYVSSGLGSPTGAAGEGGYLVYVTAGTLRAVAFDLARLATRGPSVPVISDVVTMATGGVNAVVAGDGTLAYVAGGVAGRPRTLVWVDREGRETPILAPPRTYAFPRLSPDGTRIAVYAQDQDLDLWLWDLTRRTPLTRATFDPALDPFPLWTRDGHRLIFSSSRASGLNLFWEAADGSGAVERLTDSLNLQRASAVSPDGQRLIFTEVSTQTDEDVMQVTLDATHRVTPLLQSPFAEGNAVVSPDGRWLAYDTNESGQFEIAVRPFPDVISGHWQVSTAGGTRPLWAPSGRELFYASPTGALMRVGVGRGSSWEATPSLQVVKEGYLVASALAGRSFDISLDGQRFLMIKDSEGPVHTAAPPQLVVVQHWVEELKRLVPTK